MSPSEGKKKSPGWNLRIFKSEMGVESMYSIWIEELEKSILEKVKTERLMFWKHASAVIME